MVDFAKAREFMATHARLLDRRRLDALLGSGPPEALVAALAAYRNGDGGFGWALEPDLRAPSSQPAGALHAFEVLGDAAPLRSPMAAELCEWLESATLPDGGLPFVVAGADDPGTHSLWAKADATTSSLHMTTAVAGYALRVAEHDPAVAGHPWLRRACDYCMNGIQAMSAPSGAHELSYSLRFLDAAVRTIAEAEGELERLAGLVPPSGVLEVVGGLEGERLSPLDYSPEPGRPLRRHIAPEAVDRELDRLAAEQRADGGWEIDFRPASPGAAVEWRGYLTLLTLATLRANGGLDEGYSSAV
jgi:hypothetical protein